MIPSQVPTSVLIDAFKKFGISKQQTLTSAGNAKVIVATNILAFKFKTEINKLESEKKY